MPLEPNNGFQNRENNQVITLGEWLITLLLMAIPVVNIVLLFVWGFTDSTPISKKNYARASLIMMAVGIILSILLSATLISFFARLGAADIYY